MSGPCALALVLMLDSSSSVSTERFAFQRDATADALESAPVVRAMEHGGLAVSAVGFSHRSKVLVGWTVLRNAKEAHRFALALRAVGHSYGPSTLTGAGLDFSLAHLRNAPCGDRQVVDVSTDGPGDDEPRILAARREAEARDVQVNGLLVTPDYPALIPRDWQEREVDRGLDWMRSMLLTADGFALHANGREEYPSIIRRKLAAEVASAGMGAGLPEDSPALR